MPPQQRSGGRSRTYEGSALQQAVQKRRNQDSWTGLHRGFQKGLRAASEGSKLGRWAMPGAVGAAVLIFVVGVVWAIAGGGGPEEKPAAQNGSNPCCARGSGTPSAGPQQEVLPTGDPAVMPLPTISTKPGTTPTARPSATTPRNSPTPTQTQTQQNASLSGSASTSCSQDGSDWMVTISVTATLSGAPAGSDPTGQAGKSGDLKNLNPVGTGTSFSGSVTVNVGTEATGTLQWNFSVTVSGAGTVSDSGSKGYSC